MMRTAIFTGRDNTTLTIKTSEAVQLVQMNSTKPPISLSSGTNSVIVGAGVFKVISVSEVDVKADVPEFQVEVTANDKDGDWPDPQPSLLKSSVSLAAIRAFFATGARSLILP
jgi:hypothetical protein